MKYGMAILCSIAVLISGGCGASKKTASLEASLSGAVVDANGSTIPAKSLLDTDYLLLYFSAHWCPPCQAFTPKLVDFYHANGGGSLFDLVFISSDHSEEAMFSYMRETRMPWPAVRFRSESAKSLNDSYSGDGIPRLVLFNPKGDIIADSFKGKKYLGPQHVLEKLEPLLAKGKTDPVEPTAETGEQLPTSDKLANKFKINGFGQGSENDIAIINGQFTTVGDELDKGVVIEDITGTYVEVSCEGNRYRLYP